ncbi:MAG: GerMN domain-containing protein [Christensenellales bacterium]
MAIFCCACGAENASDNEPVQTPAPSVPITRPDDNSENKIENFTLFFPGASQADYNKLFSEKRLVLVTDMMSAVDQAVAELLEGPTEEAYRSAFPEDVAFLRSEQSGDYVTIHFSPELLQLSEFDLLLAKVSVVNTLTALSGVQYVTVMCDGKELPIRGSGGPMAMQNNTVTELWDRINSEQSGKENTRAVALYFQDTTQEYLLPEIRTITITGDPVTSLINELKKGPVDRSQHTPVIGEEISLLSEPAMDILLDGRNIVRINLSEDIIFMRSTDRQKRQRIGAIVLSICSMFPEVDVVSIMMNSRPITAYTDTMRQVVYLERELFTGYIADTLTLYYPNRLGRSLVSVRHTIAMDNITQDSQRKNRTQLLLEHLFAGPLETDTGRAASLPVLLTYNDVHGYRIDGDLMVLNMSTRAIEKMMALTPEEQRITVYAIVNTLCQIGDVKQVQFLRENQLIEASPGQHVSLYGPLMPNVGLLSDSRVYSNF